MLYMSFVYEEFTFLNSDENLPADSKTEYFKNQSGKILSSGEYVIIV